MKLFGAGGHAKVIIDILESQSISVDGILDDNQDLKSLLNFPVNQTSVTSPLIISVGDNKTRKILSERFSEIEFGKAIHKNALCSKYASYDDGTVIMQGAVVQAGANIGKHCIINTSASVDHDCIIEDFVHISPHVTLCGNVYIGEGTHIGAGSIILPGVKVGKWCIIGAGSVVSKNLPDYVLAVGNRCEIKKKLSQI